jgi:hypothetical protein
MRNISQLAKVTSIDGITVMGRLNEVAYDANGTYALSVGKSVLHVPGDWPVDIRRSAQLDTLVNISDDLSEGLEVDDAA